MSLRFSASALALLVFLCGSTVFGQNIRSPIWERRDLSRVFDIAADKAGNVYVAGQAAAGTIVTLKYDTDGNLQWCRDESHLVVAAIRVGPDSNVYIAASVAVSGVGHEAVVLKRSSSGAFIWQSSYAGPEGWGHNALFTELTIDSAGNAYASGQVANTNVGSGASMAMVVKFDINGNLQWAAVNTNHFNNGSTATAGEPASVVDEANDCIYTAWGPWLESGGLYTVGSGLFQIDNSDGSIPWTVVYSNLYHQVWRTVDVDANGNVYVSGSSATKKFSPEGVDLLLTNVYPTMVLLMDRKSNTLYTGTGVTAYKPDGTELWHDYTTGVGKSLALDTNHNIVVSGMTGVVNRYTILIGEYSPAGIQLWQSSLGTFNGAGDHGVVVDEKGNSYFYREYASVYKFTYDGFFTTLAADQSQVVPDDSISYTVKVGTAHLPQDHVTVIADIPSNTTFVSASGGYTLNGSTISWSIPSLPAFSSQTNFFTVHVVTNVPGGAVIVNRSQATSTANPMATRSPYWNVYVATFAVAEDSVLGDQQDIPYSVDPVHPGIGNYTYGKTLFRLATRNLPVTFGVTYNSKGNQNAGPLGFGWSHSYDVRLITTAGVAVIQWEDRHKEYFHQLADGSYLPYNCLTRNILQAPSVTNDSQAILPNGVRYLFASNGLLSSIKDPNGFTVSLEYASTILTQLVDTVGRQVRFQYDQQLLTNVSLPFLSYSAAMAYDADSNLVALTDFRSNTWQFIYDSAHRLVAERDALGTVVNSNVYDAAGRVAQQYDAYHRLTSYSYVTNDSSGWLRVNIAAPGGYTVSQFYNQAFEIRKVIDGLGEESVFGYTLDGERNSTLDKRNHTSSAAYDGAGNPTSITDRAGVKSTLTFGNNNKVTSIENGLGNSSEFARIASGDLSQVKDAVGNYAYISYSSGRPDSVQDGHGNMWTLINNSAGLVGSLQDPIGQTVSFKYDGMGRLTNETHRSEDGSFKSTAFDPNGNVVSRRDFLGKETRYTYDANNNLLTETFVPTAATTVYSYNKLNQLTNIVSALGRSRSLEYDAAGRLARVTDADGVWQSFTYDNAGRVIAKTDASGSLFSNEYDSAGNLITCWNRQGGAWHNEYDAENRMTASMTPSGGLRTFAYDRAGHLVVETNEVGRVTYYSYDKAGRLTNMASPGGATIQYQYDNHGNVTNLTDPLSHSWAFDYDGIDRLVTRTAPNLTYDYYQYLDSTLGTRRTARDAKQYTSYYDAKGQLKSLALPSGAGTIYQYYDAAGNLTNVSSPSIVNRIVYDELNQKTAVSNSLGFGLAYTYTAAGRLKTIMYPGGKTVTNSYDAAGRLSTVTDWAGRQVHLQYDGHSLPSQITFPNGTRKICDSDEEGRVTRLRHEKSDTSLIQEYTFSHDHAGRITNCLKDTAGILGQLTTQASTSAYDSVNRLLITRGPGATNFYWFDLRGNLVSNNLAGVVTRYVYDPLDRLTLSSNGTLAVTNRYDGMGQRVAKTTGAVETRYLADDGRLYCELDNTNGVLRYFIYAGPLAYSVDTGGSILVYHGDIRGSVENITDGSQSIVQSYAYSPYGEVIGSSGVLTNDLRFVGIHGVLQDENGLCLMRHRFYDPKAGRFMTEDPAGLDVGLNLYEYAKGDPVGYVDPSGLSAEAAALEMYVYFANYYANLAYTSLQESLALTEAGDVVGAELASDTWLGLRQLGMKYAVRAGEAALKSGNLNAASKLLKLESLVESGMAPGEAVVVETGAGAATAAEGGVAVSLGTAAVILVVEGVVVYVVTREVSDATGLDDYVTEFLYEGMADKYSANNLVNRDLNIKKKWKETQRLDQKVSKLEQMPGFKGLMQLKDERLTGMTVSY
jgi:RHS repeat-associated protein